MYYLIAGLKKKKKAFTGICIYYIHTKGQIWNFLLALLKQLRKYSGFNYANTISSIIFKFSLTN